ncbi:MAG: hypothetical protein K5662_02135 [Lachnospiraceae bacterium]|nr:hypothetical protein [Lachnospiraceae bacterium]
MQNLDTVAVEDIREGASEMTVYYVDDFFMYSGSTPESATERAYFVLLDQADCCIAVDLTGSKNRRAYKLMNDIYDAMDEMDTNGAEPDYSSFDCFTVHGSLKRLSGEELGFYEDYVSSTAEYYGITEEEVEEYYLPYILKPDEDILSFWGIVISLFILLFIGFGFWLLYNGLFKNPRDIIKKYTSTKSNPDKVQEEIEDLCDNQDGYNGVWINDKYFVYTSGLQVKVYDVEDVLWLFKQVTTTRVNFIPTGKSYSICFGMADKKKYLLRTTKKKSDADLEYFAGKLPDVICGYSDEISSIFTKDISRIKNEVAKRRAARVNPADNYMEMPDETNESSYSDVDDLSYDNASNDEN